MMQDTLRYHAGQLPWGTMLQFVMAKAIDPANNLESVKRIKIPMMITHGAADQSNDFLASIALYQHCATPSDQKILQIIPGGAHNLWADQERLKMFDAWCVFIEKAMAGEFNPALAA